MSQPKERDRFPEESLEESNDQPRASSESSFVSADASDCSLGSPHTATQIDVSEDVSRKRKADGWPARLSKAKRAKHFYSDKYRELYNSTIEGHTFWPVSDQRQSLLSSQIGSTVWTSAEKDIFFHVLARKGRHGVGAIAAELGSKGEPEIVQYIELLRKGLVDAELLRNRPMFVNKPSFDAAHEISPECITALDHAGDALSIRQQAQDEKVEKCRHGPLWLLTPKIGNWADKCLRDSKENDEVCRLLPAATLLNLKHFLWLSRRFFMNSSDLECNWSSYADKPKYPTIMNSAFSDFHTLATSITKRLVQSTLYFAISRLRAEGFSNSKRQRLIRRQDVSAALDVLKMRGSVRSYWSGVARRCKLHVFESVEVSGVTGRYYSYDEVEDLLANYHKIDKKDSEVRSVDDRDINGIDSEVSATRSESGLSNGPNGTDDFDNAGPSPSVQSNEERLNEKEQQEELEEEYLETLDQRQSQAEESYLWKLLNEEPASKSDLALGKEKLKTPAAVRKDNMELMDWTSWTEYGAEWETLESPVPAEAFQNNK